MCVKKSGLGVSRCSSVIKMDRSVCQARSIAKENGLSVSRCSSVIKRDIVVEECMSS